MFKEKTCNQFTSELASKTSVPGGGGASALCSAVAVALGDMVGEYTVGKEKYKDVEAEMFSLMERAQVLRKRLLDLIDKDAEVFYPLSKAYSIPKDDPTREKVMEECLKNAMTVPLEIFRVTLEVIDILSEFGKKGSKIILSDAATGAAIALGALRGAAINVKVNTKSLKDRTYAEVVDGFIDNNLKAYTEKAENIFNDIYKGF
ncbi:MAG: cyclodeaminase/cyclohydrolase family protein [Clostridia bacterium]|nr:cyclodeaminase/cyclohydrolase family protein [Clostridia bacterium]